MKYIILLIPFMLLGCIQGLTIIQEQSMGTSYKLPQSEIDAKVLQEKECDKINGLFDEFGYASHSSCSTLNADGTYTRHGFSNLGGKWVVLK